MGMEAGGARAHGLAKYGTPIPNVCMVPIPVPLPVHFTNAYCIDTEDGYVVIDCGMDTAEARSRWAEYSRMVGLNRSTTKAIFVTHYHVDHIGLGKWMSDWLDAPVFMLEDETNTASEVYGPSSDWLMPTREFYLNQGLPNSLWPVWKEQLVTMRKDVQLPNIIETLRDGQRLSFGNLTLEVIEQMGHTDHQAVFQWGEPRIIFTGDQVLSRITPNISLWPGRDKDPLSSYLSSLDKLLTTDATRGLPAHERMIVDLRHRIDQIKQHHIRRSKRVIQILREGPQTGYDVALRLFDRKLTVYEMRFALGEALAHLAYLQVKGLIEQNGGMPTRYTVAESRSR